MITKHDFLAIGNDRLRRLATYASVSVASLLIIGKLVAYFLTDSVAMLSSLLDSTVDLLSSLVTMYGVASALRPPDQDHRFGHGKAEPLAALAQAAFITGSSILLFYEALSRFYAPHEVQNINIGYVSMIVAIILTLSLLQFQQHVVKKTKSMAIGADLLHYLGDLLINVAVLAAFWLQDLTGLSWIDPVFGIGVALALMFSAWHIAREALNVLMDRELSVNDRERIITIIKSIPEVMGVHDLRTRSDSDRVFMEFHLELDPETTLRVAHEITEMIMAKLGEAFPNADIMVHQDPEGVDEPRLDQIINEPTKTRA